VVYEASVTGTEAGPTGLMVGPASLPATKRPAN